MDALRARMIREGYLLEGLTSRVRERVWYSLAGKCRRPQLAALLEVQVDEIDDLVAQVRCERAQVTKERTQRKVLIRV